MQQSLVVFALFESEYVVKSLKLLKVKRSVKRGWFFFIYSTMI